ncbi:MAG: hypothetical protein WCJ74_01830 [bacterium]
MYRLKILDCKTLDDRQWMLCRGNLAEYLESLKKDFYNFSIQRKIVKNQYLDTIVTTIKQGDPIPLITLTYNETGLEPIVGDDVNINMDNIEILDGLQRTFRLWAHDILIKEYDKRQIVEPTTFAKEIKNQFPIFFDTGILSLTKVKKFYAENEFQQIKSAFKDFDIYFIIWVNLPPKKVIHKMLVLNAGQRSVSKTHQFELLFLYLWEDLQKEQLGISLYREKDEKANKIKGGERNAGDYMFTTVIVGLRSFLEKKPLRVSIGDLDISELGQEESSRGINEEIFSADFIRSFLQHVKEIDEAVITKEGDEGKKWFVKDTTLSGILAGLGKYAEINENSDIDYLLQIAEQSFKELLQKTKDVGFNLVEFKQQYNILSSRSVNIGNFIRKVVMNYTITLLQGEQPSWEKIFKSNLKEDVL